jgi:hypothetical protein
MMKFYRLEATGILAGPEKLSTILVTPVSESTAFAGWKSGAFKHSRITEAKTPLSSIIVVEKLRKKVDNRVDT